MAKAASTTTKKASALSNDFLDKIKGQLKEEQERLERELAKLNVRNKGGSDFDPAFPDYGDKEDENAAEVAEYATNLSLEQDLQRALRDVNSALDRVKKGTYGICKYCKKHIEERRLMARATSSACVECKKTITQEI
jgi:DnaK suppressor protein